MLNSTRNVAGAVEFTVSEYCLFAILLFVIFVFMFYYNCFDSRSRTVSGLVFGGKNMGVFPVTMGLIASHVTSITLLGVPVEIYMRGTQYWVSVIALITVSIVASFVYLPVFHKLQLTSPFEYLEIRFSTHTRTIASLLFVISKLMLLPIVPYVPMLAFKKVVPTSANHIAGVVSIACATVIAIGGLKAVISLSILSVFVACAATAIPGGVGLVPFGFTEVWNIASVGGRTVFYNNDPNLANTSLWAVCLAMITNWLWKLGVCQSSMQKLLAVPTIGKARICIAASCLFIILFKCLSSLMGLVMYAWFAGCDPLLSGKIRKHEQLVPLFLTYLSNKFPGIVGVFLTAIFAATTCSLSSAIISLASVIYEDLIRCWMPKGTSERTACATIELICFLVGVYAIAVIFREQDIAKVIHFASSFTGVTGGIILGLFTLGIVFHRANCAGALCGAMVSLLLCGWLVLGAENAVAQGKLFFEVKSLNANNCSRSGNASDIMPWMNNLQNLVNITDITEGMGSNNHPFPSSASLTSSSSTTKGKQLQTLFRISFTYCSLAGALTVILIGLPMSYLTGKAKASSMNPAMFCPLTQRFLPKARKWRRNRGSESFDSTNADVYLALDEALRHLKEVIDR